MATVLVLTFAGCAPGQVQTDASAFVNEHVDGATSASRAATAAEAQVSRLSKPPTGAQLERLARIAAEARRKLVRVGEWSVAAEGIEEEDLPRAEAEVTEGADDLTDAMSALKVYARAASAEALGRYVSELAHGREQWNGGVSQLWHLAHRSDPPTV